MMEEMNERRLPVGIQSFKKIREENCVYVGSTDIFRGSKKCSIDNSFPTTTFSIVLYWSE